MEITINIDKIPNCCVLCDFYKQLIYEKSGTIQKSKCLLTGRISTYYNKKRVNGFSRHEHCSFLEKL